MLGLVAGVSVRYLIQMGCLRALAVISVLVGTTVSGFELS